ncbi:hypothetical protein F4779DRAFT_621035 [Xylariaceae sp. FL0662B]|nr:hypothetical protein F4779DRAFT_621035 [Xylariaceae sp. FL0662B]
MPSEEPEKGDKVSWNWGGSAPGGTVAETKDAGSVAVTSKRGNTIRKKAAPGDPAVRIERSGNDVVKRASELTVEGKKKKSSGKGGSGGGGKGRGEKKGQDQDQDRGRDNEGEKS